MKHPPISRVLILTEADDPWSAAVMEPIDLVAPLFWASPEVLERIGARYRAPVVSAADAIGDLGQLFEQSFGLANTICSSVPRYRDVNPLLGHENRLADILFPYLAMPRVLDHLETGLNADTVLVFPRGGVWADAAARSGSYRTVLQASRIAGPSRAPWARGARYLQEAVATRDPKTLLHQPVERLGPRFRPPRSIHVRPGGVWAYSSYVNFSKALARHDSLRDVGFHWLTNGESAKRGLPYGVSPFHLWDFKGIRSRKEHQAVTVAVTDHLRDALARELIPPSSRSEIVKELSLAVAATIPEIDLQQAFLDQAKPEEIWVANQWGSELSMTQSAQSRSIRVVQVQHGMLEHNYRWSACYTDRFLVWGEAWKDALPSTTKGRVVVVNPASGAPDAARVRRAIPGRRVTFFTTPSGQPLWNEGVMTHESLRLLKGLAEAGWRATVRVHPNDSIRSWRAAIRKLGSRASNQVQIDQRTDMPDLLTETDIAIIFRSTVLLGCAVAGIETVALGWYPWVWDDLLTRTGVVHLSDSIADVIQVCEEWNGRLAHPAGDITPLLANRQLPS